MLLPDDVFAGSVKQVSATSQGPSRYAPDPGFFVITASRPTEDAP